jgi:hypothetical protein
MNGFVAVAKYSVVEWRSKQARSEAVKMVLDKLAAAHYSRRLLSQTLFGLVSVAFILVLGLIVSASALVIASNKRLNLPVTDNSLNFSVQQRANVYPKRKRLRRHHPAVRLLTAPYRGTKAFGKALGRGAHRLFMGGRKRNKRRY